MDNWYKRVSENLEEVLSEHCDLLDALIEEGDLYIEARPNERDPQISIQFFDEEEILISYNLNENYFYTDLQPPEIELPVARIMFDSLEKLVIHIHSVAHQLMEDDVESYEDDENDEGNENVEENVAIGFFDSKENFLEHIQKLTSEKENKDDYLKNVEWISNVESTVRIDVPKKKEIKSIIHFGEIKEQNEFVIKKAIFSNDAKIGKAELSYLKLNKEEAEVIKAELDKYTAS